MIRTKTRIFTGCYQNCKSGNLISISGDRGKTVNFHGKVLSCLAPKREFWQTWHDRIDKIPEEENTKYYIEEYYKQVLLKVDFEALFEHEKDVILLCYEESNEFCHRHIVSAYLELKYGILVPEIAIDEIGNLSFKKKTEKIKRLLEEILKRDGGKTENFLK